MIVILHDRKMYFRSCEKYTHFLLLSVLQASALLNTHEEQKQKIVFLYKFLANASTVYTDVFPVM